MSQMREDMEAFRRVLQEGALPRSYRALLTFMAELRAHFSAAPHGYAVSGLYQGYLDMTYFALFPAELRARNLKIAIVFNYSAFRFEAWLSAGNREAQRQCWEMMRLAEWPGYRVVAPGKGIDSILECDLAEDFDLSDPAGMTARLESGVSVFIARIQQFLSSEEGAPRRTAVRKPRTGRAGR